jgi:hypothetical protein
MKYLGDFTTVKINESVSIPISILKEGINDIKDYLNIPKRVKPYTKSEFYRDIIISVFCVFNISRDANNPPPIPYLDINNFKQKYFYHKNNIVRYQEISSIDKGTFTILNVEFDDIGKKIESYGNKIISLKQSRDFEGIKKFFNESKILIDSGKPVSFEKKTTDLFDSFIKSIDNSNAVSAIGTLEYLDTISKFNAINNICSNGLINTINDEYIKGNYKSIGDMFN